MLGIVKSPAGQLAQSRCPRQGSWMQSRLSPVRFGRSASRARGDSSPLLHRTDPLTNNRLWGRVTWPVSILLFAVPLALALFTLLVTRLSAGPEVDVRVTDRYTGQQILGAML